jgi:tRNA A-37 threonylcarbamoyl transferase component Bud32
VDRSRSRVIREAVERFEDCWEAGSPPEIAAFAAEYGRSLAVPLAPVELGALLIALVRVDLEYRWRAWSAEKPHPSLDGYADHLPELGLADAWPDEVIISEYKNRRRWGDRPDPEKFADQFPESRRERLLPLIHQIDVELATEDAEGPASWPSIPGYDIVDEIGSGAFSVVYKARQEGLDGFVAIKMLNRPWRRDVKAVTRFEHEARLISLLEHDHIVKIRHIGRHDGFLFLVLEYLAGGTLEQKLKGGPLNADEAARMLESLADALAAAHAAGIIHRDVKPANILLDRLGRAKIGDFGLARLANSEQTGATEVLGTPNYMAPEQASGRSKFVTPETDVYALGATLYAMLSGRPPFVGDSPEEVLAAVRSEPPKPLAARRRSPSRDLVTICKRCLEKDPSDRLGSAEVLRDELRLYLEGRPLTIRPPGLAERIYRWVRRRPSQAAVVALAPLAFILCVLALVAWKARGDAVTARDQLSSAKLAADLASARAREAEMGEHAASLAAARSRAALKASEADRFRANSLRYRADAYMNYAMSAEALLRKRSTNPASTDSALVRSLLHLLDHREEDPQAASQSARAFLAFLDKEQAEEAKRNETALKSVNASVRAGIHFCEELVREFPTIRSYRALLGRCYYILGALAIAPVTDLAGAEALLAGRGGIGPQQQAELESTLALFDKALATLPPEGDDVRAVWFASWMGRAAALIQLGRITEALLAWDQALAFADGPEKAANLAFRSSVVKGAEIEQSRLPWSRPPRVDHVKAIQMAEALANHDGVSPAAIYNAACAFSLASLDAKSAPAERARRADRATAYLQRIAANGYFQPKARGLLGVFSKKDTLNELLTDHDLDPLRGHPDFKNLATTAAAKAAKLQATPPSPASTRN